MKVLGFMSGTSLDAVDMAVLETDGREITAFGPVGESKLSEPTRGAIQRATDDARSWARGTRRPSSFAAASWAVAQEHLAAAREFLHAAGIKASSLDLVGFHGQTVLHERPVGDTPGRTVQLGDASLLAKGLGLPVAHDFRSADVAAGGQGAPLAPIYHAALVRHSGIDRTVAVLNLGGVGNVTLVTSDEADLLAFDTGPANGMIDQLVQDRTGQRYDRDGILARSGKVDEEVLALLLSHPYFLTAGPKSLDRYEFSLNSVRNLSLEEACATLTAFAAQAVAYGVESLPVKPHWLIACGGGRHNPVLMREIGARAGVPLAMAEEMNWRGDSIEAEAFAYLAARCHEGLPISFPGTTGVASAMTGGVIVEP